MRRFWIILSLAVLLSTTAAQAQSICRDGTASRSSGRGTCSHHGGVAKPAEPTPTTTGGNSGDIVLPSTPAPPAAIQARERASVTPQDSAQRGASRVWVNTKSGVYHCPERDEFRDTPFLPRRRCTSWSRRIDGARWRRLRSVVADTLRDSPAPECGAPSRKCSFAERPSPRLFRSLGGSFVDTLANRRPSGDDMSGRSDPSERFLPSLSVDVSSHRAVGHDGR